MSNQDMGQMWIMRNVTIDPILEACNTNYNNLLNSFNNSYYLNWTLFFILGTVITYLIIKEIGKRGEENVNV